jgi:hypothetical protein
LGGDFGGFWVGKYFLQKRISSPHQKRSPAATTEMDKKSNSRFPGSLFSCSNGRVSFAGKNKFRNNQPIARDTDNHITPRPQRPRMGLNMG